MFPIEYCHLDANFITNIQSLLNFTLHFVQVKILFELFSPKNLLSLAFDAKRNLDLDFVSWEGNFALA